MTSSISDNRIEVEWKRWSEMSIHHQRIIMSTFPICAYKEKKWHKNFLSLLLHFTFLAILIVLAGCSKDDNSVYNPDFSETLIIGDTNGAYQINAGTTLKYHGQFFVDIDRDNTSDIRIGLVNRGSLSFGDYITINISTINSNARLLVESFPDSTYYFNGDDTTYSGDTTFYHVNKLFSCYPMDGYMKEFINRSKIPELEKGYEIQAQDTRWDSATVRLNPISRDQMLREDYGKTFVIFNIQTVDECHYLPYDKNYYLPFKILPSGQMGWITVKLLSEVSIEIVNYATQIGM